jgi:DNA polymerase-3 subunit delta'
VSFDSVHNQERPKSILKGALQKGQVACSYLFFGPRGVGKQALALELAKAVNCEGREVLPCDHCPACRRIDQLNYPDVRLYFPTAHPKKIKPEELQEALRQRVANLYLMPRYKESDAIHIEIIRKIEREANYKSYEGKKKVFILADADRMNISAANALLKTLEEPPPNVLFVLTTAHPSKLPATVLSRCQQIRFGRLSDAVVARALETAPVARPDRIRLASRLAQGNLGRALELLHEDVEHRRSEVLKILATGLSGDLISTIKLAERLGRSRSPAANEENLEALQVWYRDLLLLLEGKEDFLINEDLKPQLREMASQYDWQGVQQSLDLIQDTRMALAANVNVELAWMVLLNKLRRQQRQQS